jgi:hypothetical protein
MSHDEFRSWRWDREDKSANRQALVLFEYGHTIRCDHLGLLIDGRRIDTTPLYEPFETVDGQASQSPIELGEDGVLHYRGRPVARLAPPAPGTARPGSFELLDAA